mmetsp:Transcript_25011/g.54525  ORF Transcript_25011/g.54525 Transcript_25011/m.54525 type:complete len:934 (+) Transcript_25011:232-3033(+)
MLALAPPGEGGHDGHDDEAADTGVDVERSTRFGTTLTKRLLTKRSRSNLTISSSKQRSLAILDSNAVTAVMTFVTIYALFSDDLRILTVDASGDVIYTVFSSISFFLFVLEIVLQCWCREQYMHRPDAAKLKSIREAVSFKERMQILKSAIAIGSFYFWLDSLATISMTLEIPWMSLSSETDMSNGSSLENARAGRASRAGARAARVIKVVRMIRLVRLVKLYKYVGDAKQQTKRGSSVIAPDDSDLLMENMPPESHVGAEMSARTTKKVIVGILVMLIGIPLLQVDKLQYMNEFGMQIVFERRQHLSNLVNTTGDIQNATDSWSFSENLFLNNSTCIYLEYEGFDDNQHTIAPMPSGRVHADVLQGPEKMAVVISGESTEDLPPHHQRQRMMAIFDVSARAREEAVLGILLTTFVISLLAIGTMTFSRDVNTLVIVPIEKMVKLVRDISANPLGKNHYLRPEEIKEMDDGMETTLLLHTISKIAGLMRIGFGEAGAEIIGRNLNATHGDDDDDEDAGLRSNVNVLGNGTKIQSIFAFCDVRNFTDTTECLQEEVMLFVNRIAHILHSIVVQCNGAANKNIGDAFLLTWKLQPSSDDNISGANDKQDDGLVADKALYSLLQTMVEMARHEDFICNFSPTALGALYERMPRYKCRIGCGLHVGWAVEGAIGTDKKIDASYISPHVNWSEFLEASTKEYGVPLLMSQPFYDLLTPQARTYCRCVDRIRRGANDAAPIIELYTYEANLDQEFSNPILLEKRRRINRRTTRRRSTMHTQRKKSGYRRMVVDGDESDTTSASARGLGGSIYSSVSSNSIRCASLAASDHVSSINNTTSKDDVLGEAPDIVLKPVTSDIWDQDKDMVMLRSNFSEEQRVIWNKGMETFIIGDWSQAADNFRRVLDMSSGTDGPAKKLLQRIESAGGVAPDNWAGYWSLA